MQTLATTSPRRGRPVEVHNPATGMRGWAALYGTAGFGGVRISVYETRKAALAASVSDDTKAIERDVTNSSRGACWHIVRS